MLALSRTAMALVSPTPSVLPVWTVMMRLSSAAKLPVPTVVVVGFGVVASQTVVCPVVVQLACASAPNNARGEAASAMETN